MRNLIVSIVFVLVITCALASSGKNYTITHIDKNQVGIQCSPGIDMQITHIGNMLVANCVVK